MKLIIEIEREDDLGWTFTIRRGVAVISSGLRLNYRDALEAALIYARNLVQ